MKFDWKNLIIPSVHLAEAVLGSGTGDKKLAFVSNILQTALLVAAVSGAIPPSAATDLTSMHNRINEVVADENDTGRLDSVKPLIPQSLKK